MPAKYAIKLTRAELAVGTAEGVRRRLQAMKRGAVLKSDHREAEAIRKGEKIKPANPGDRLKKDIEGACAEIAVHILANKHWSGINHEDGPDVGENTGVRHTPGHNGHLIVYESDPDERVMVLVTGTPPVLVLHGYLPAGGAKLKKYNREWRPSTEFWVPQRDLKQFLSDQLYTPRITEVLTEISSEEREEREESLFSTG